MHRVLTSATLSSLPTATFELASFSRQHGYFFLYDHDTVECMWSGWGFFSKRATSRLESHLSSPGTIRRRTGGRMIVLGRRHDDKTEGMVLLLRRPMHRSTSLFEPWTRRYLSQFPPPPAILQNLSPGHSPSGRKSRN